MTAWTDFATKYFREQQKKNPKYQFKDALKAAGKLYKKGSNSVSASVSSSTSTRKVRKSKKRRTARRGGR
jgi:hypothetical protein